MNTSETPAAAERQRVGAPRLATYGSFVKLKHTLFSLPMIYAGAILAHRQMPQWSQVFLIGFAALGGRIAAMGLNRIIDREIDRRNPRTASRELPRGAMRLSEAWGVTLAGAAIYLLSAAILGPRCLQLAPIPLAVFAVYPYLKRVTPLCHFGLGFAWSLAPLGGWIAVSPATTYWGPAVLLCAFSFFWVSGFDIIYATQDEAIDRAQRLHSLPADIGRARALHISRLLHAAAFLQMVFLYWLEMRTPLAFCFLVLIAALLVIEHAKVEDVEVAFFRVNAILGFVVLGFVVSGIVKNAMFVK
ncbi:MAG: UbiA family prenyltransferase [Candidatus Omnitrophica bacterium]|nr:UbiA family prenyltransferase [Candidatus Omnitrophota bacterium]